MRILAALDETARAPVVLDAALRGAMRLEARVVPLRAITVPPELPPAAATHYRDPLPAAMLERARDDLAALTRAAPPDALEAPVVATGLPWRVIVEVADERAVDLIVVGSHGYDGLDRLFGTTARRVADAAHRDVLVVHRPLEPIRSVLVALSGAARDRAVLARGLALAHTWSAKAHLLRVLEVGRRSSTRPGHAVVRYIDADRTPDAGAPPEMCAVDSAIASRRVALAASRAWRAVLEAAREASADLVVVGSHGHLPRDALARTTPGHMADEALENVYVVHGDV